MFAVREETFFKLIMATVHKELNIFTVTNLYFPLYVFHTGSSKVYKPMTKEEWEKKQNETRRVIDPETGRTR